MGMVTGPAPRDAPAIRESLPPSGTDLANTVEAGKVLDEISSRRGTFRGF